jgi:hypothetical protein
MKVLAIDIGGTYVKLLVTGQKEHSEFASIPGLTPAMLLAGVRNLAKDWKYGAVSFGYPGPVCHNRPLAEPFNLGNGWVGFDYRAAFQRPVKIINDAAMQGLGSYRRGRMLFLGLGTGLGSANRPSNVILADRLTPEVLCQLVALYEHSVFTQGAIWNVDSFDQWGVEPGKILAQRIVPELESEKAPKLKHDSSTNSLIQRYRKMKGTK